MRIKINKGATINMGNYESARIDVGIEMDTTKKELKDDYDWCLDWVNDHLNANVDDLEE